LALPPYWNGIWGRLLLQLLGEFRWGIIHGILGSGYGKGENELKIFEKKKNNIFVLKAIKIY
jgi:hypothetical protein